MKNNAITTYNLLGLLGDYSVYIPIIQRDYAQGRSGHETLRNTFISALRDFIISQEDDKNLDFIYGYIEQDNIFQPIDGQQRLTTLWLLHVYLFRFKLKDASHKTILEKFSYRTRLLSKEFCKALVDNEGSIGFDKSRPSKAFSDAGFIPTDPDATISSMVNMLDTIHEYFKNIELENIVERLNKITFRLINMGKFRLGEELYIKMNGRGRPLSAFENFKAWLAHDEKIMKNILPRIDTEWIDFFWTPETHDTIDKNMMRFINNFAIYFIVDDAQTDKINISERIEALILADLEGPLQKELYQDSSKNIFTEERLLLMCDYINYYKDFKYENKENDSAYDKLKFITDILYLRNKNRNEVQLEDWRSVIRHIIDNHRSNHSASQVLIDFFKLIKELSQYSDDIMKNLASKDLKIGASLFAKDRVAEEILKASLMYNAKEWTYEINKAQNHEYFNGRIDFILNLTKQIDSETKHETFDIVLFKKYADIFMLLFNKETRDSDTFNQFKIALLSEYDYLIYWTNYYFASSKTEFIEKRQWYDIFLNKDQISHIKVFFDDLTAKPEETLIKRLEDIRTENIKNETKWDHEEDWWRRILVLYPQMCKICEDDRIKFDNFIFLLPHKKIGMEAYEVFMYGFWHYLKEKNISPNGDYISKDPYDEKTIRFSACIDKVKVDFLRTEQSVKMVKNRATSIFEPHFEETIEKVYGKLLTAARQL